MGDDQSATVSDANRVSAWAALRADCHRQFGRYSLAGLLIALLTRRTFRPVFSLRLCQALTLAPPPVRWGLAPARLLHRVTCQLAGVDLPVETRIGAGFCLTHGWGTVISPGARIGRNVTIFHGATLGRRDRIDRAGGRATEYPVIEDEVWIGPHAIIAGGFRIGRGARIAGGAVVAGDVPAFSIVSGNPAVVVKTDAMPDVNHPAPL